MIKLITAVALFVSLANVAHAGSYIDAMRACGAEWKASDARKQVKKGEGGPAWQAFRKECTARVGWEKKGKKTSMVDVVDMSAKRRPR